MSPPLPFEIYDAALRGDLAKVITWLRKGGHVDALFTTRDRDGDERFGTMLLAAAMNDHVAVAKELLQRGATVDKVDNIEATPLMHAARRGHRGVLLLLLEHSANADQQNEWAAPLSWRLLAKGKRRV